MSIDLKKRENENEEQYIWRLAHSKDLGLLDLDWEELSNIFNRELRNDDIEYTSSTYRKPYQQAKRFFEAGVFDEFKEDRYLQELRLQQQELRKEKIKLSDERSELNRILRRVARNETFAEMVKNIICKNVKPIEIDVAGCNTSSDNDLLCHLTDIHTGININNSKNTFNQDILKQRIEKYIINILEIQKIHNSENCYIVIGEIVSGIIHNNLRLQNNIDLMEQFKYISELISCLLTTISTHFNQVYVYVTAGNHSRISQKKEDSLDGENMDILLPFYLQARLQNIQNIHICKNEIDPEIAMFSIRENTIMSSHGHKDDPKSVVQNFTMLFGIKPDIVLLGHRHTNGLLTVYDTKVIQSGCVSGTDNYSMSIRKANKPEQTVSVVNSSGLYCLYDIQLN